MQQTESAQPATEIIPRLIDYVFSSSKCSKATGGDQLQWRMSIGFRRFVAISYIMRPESMAKDAPAWKVAEALGITPTQFSRLCTATSKTLGGLAHPSARSRSHRIACSAAREGIKPATQGKRARCASVEVVAANRYRASEQRGVAAAIEAFKAGRPWSKAQSRLLFAVGYVDEDGTLTTKGVKAFSGV